MTTTLGDEDSHPGLSNGKALDLTVLRSSSILFEFGPSEGDITFGLQEHGVGKWIILGMS